MSCTQECTAVANPFKLVGHCSCIQTQKLSCLPVDVHWAFGIRACRARTISKDPAASASFDWGPYRAAWGDLPLSQPHSSGGSQETAVT